MRRLTLATLGVAALATTIGTAQAAAPKVEVQPVFGKALITGAWQPMTVTLTNPADGEAIDGDVRLILTDNRYGTPRQLGTYVHPITIPAGTGVASVRMNIQVPADTAPWVRVVVTRGHGESAPTVLVKNNDSLPVGPASGLMRILAVNTSGDGCGLDVLTGEVLGVRSLNGGLHRAAPTVPNGVPVNNGLYLNDGTLVPQRTGVTATVPARLPSERIGYDAYQIVVLGSDVDLAALSPAQSEALRGFVMQGGFLLAPNAPVWLKSAPKDQVVSSGLGHVLVASRVPTTVAAWTDLVRSATGLGSFTKALSQISQSPTYEYDNYGMAAAVLTGQGMQAMPFTTLGLFLFTYLMLAVPVHYLVLKRLDKRELAWVTTPLLACGFAVTAYQFGRVGRSTQIFHNVASIIELTPGSGAASAVGSIGIYSPERATYDVSSPLPESVFVPRNFNNTEGETTLTLDASPRGKEARVTDVSIPQWAMRSLSLRTTGMTLGQGIATELVRHGNTIRVTAVNNTGITLNGAMVRLGEVNAPLGTLTPGSKASVELAIKSGSLRFYESYSEISASQSPEERMRQQIRQSVTLSASNAAAMEYPNRTNADRVRAIPELVVTGWSDADLIPVQISKSNAPARTNAHFIMVRVPLDSAK